MYRSRYYALALRLTVLSLLPQAENVLAVSVFPDTPAPRQPVKLTSVVDQGLAVLVVHLWVINV